ncbi:MAG: hypothetical protein RLN90_00610 [Balneolaceae bacterium]
MENFKYKTAFWIIALFIISLILIGVNETNAFSDWDINWKSFSKDLGYGILIGLIPSVLIGFLAFREQFNKQLEVLGVSRQIIDSGFTQYYDEWDETILRNKLEESNEVDIYFTYGSTVINTLSRTIAEKLKDRSTIINIYLMDENNPFLVSLGSLWGKDNDKYNAEGLKKRIQSTVEEIKSIKRNLEEDQDYKGVINAYKLKYHPVFFSFYRFNNEIVFLPTKNVERKTYQVPFFICKKLNSRGVYNWCMSQINYIDEIKKDDALIKVI